MMYTIQYMHATCVVEAVHFISIYDHNLSVIHIIAIPNSV